jgi:hypothetical protein
VLDAASDQLGMPIPPPGVPGPFALDDAERLRTLMTESGFGDVVVMEAAAQLDAPSFDEWWVRTTALAGPLTQILSAMPEDASSALRERARERSRAYETADGLAMPGVSLVAQGYALPE